MWTEEHDVALKKYLGMRLSFTQAAAAINHTFNTSYSRNAAIGRANRIGLKSLCPKTQGLPHTRKPKPWDNSAISKRTYYRQRAAGIAEPTRIKAYQRKKPAEQQFTRDPCGLRQADVMPLNLNLVDLESHHCRWPYGDGPFVFCGCPVFECGPYCEAHTALSVRPYFEQRREAA